MWFCLASEFLNREGEMDTASNRTAFFRRLGRFWRGFGSGQPAPGELWTDHRTGWRPGLRTPPLVHAPTQRWLDSLP
jgi:hypothetical protein